MSLMHIIIFARCEINNSQVVIISQVANKLLRVWLSQYIYVIIVLEQICITKICILTVTPLALSFSFSMMFRWPEKKLHLNLCCYHPSPFENVEFDSGNY